MSEQEIERKQSPQAKPAGKKQSGLLSIGMIAFGVLLMIVAVGSLLLKPGAAEAPASGPARIGQRLADFTLVDLDGSEVKLSDFAGRPVLINAWATWCPPCRAEMPDLQAYYQANRESGFVVLAVNAGEPRDLAASFTEAMGLTFPVLLDPQYALMDRLGIRNYPTSILVGRDGKVKSIHIGLFLPADMEKELSPYLNEN